MSLNLYKLHSNPELLDAPGKNASPELAYWWAKNISDDMHVPQHVVDVINKDKRLAAIWHHDIDELSKNLELSVEYATDVLKGKNVPKQITTVISKNPQSAYDYAVFVLKRAQVPTEIEDAINKNEIFRKMYSGQFKEDADNYQKLNEKLPIESLALMGQLAKRLYDRTGIRAFKFEKQILDAYVRDENDVLMIYSENIFEPGERWPEAEKEILNALDTENAYEYVQHNLDGSRWPEFEARLKKMRNDYIVKYDGDYLEDFDNSVCAYAQEIVGPKRFPEGEPSLAAEASSAYWYAAEALKGQNVPKEIIDGIKKDPKYAQKYQQEVLKGQPWME